MLWVIVLGLAASVPDTAVTSVAVDVSGLDDSAFQRLAAVELQKKLVVRLAEDGFAVVSKARPHDVLVTIESDRESVLLSAHALRSQTSAGARVPWQGTTDSLHLEVMHHVLDLVRQVERKERAAIDRVPEASVSTRSLAIGVGLAVLSRSSAIDLGASLDAELEIGNALVFRLATAATRASVDDLAVTELITAAGSGLRLLDGRTWQATAEVWLGAAHHLFSFGDSTGYRIDPLVGLQVAAAWRYSRHVALRARVLPLWVGRPRTHVVAGTESWRSPSFRLLASVDAVWEF